MVTSFWGSYTSKKINELNVEKQIIHPQPQGAEPVPAGSQVKCPSRHRRFFRFLPVVRKTRSSFHHRVIVSISFHIKIRLLPGLAKSLARRPRASDISGQATKIYLNPACWGI